MIALHPDTLSIEQIRAWSGELAGLLDGNEPATPVPTCGEWTLADLVWHLTEVQLFWGHIIGNRPAGPETYERPARPTGDLAPGLRAAGNDLVSLLGAADPEDRAWSWSGDHSVGFSVRRQIHEALIHCIDGLMATGQPLPEVTPWLAADGIDELVQVMLTGTPDWAIFDPSGDVIELRASDTDDRWVMQAGQVIGDEPTSGAHLELDGYELCGAGVDGVATPKSTIEAPAIDLLLWMWGRRPDPTFEASADAEAARRLRRTIISATQ